MKTIFHSAPIINPNNPVIKWIAIPFLLIFIAILSPLLAMGNLLAYFFIGIPVLIIGALVLLKWPGAGFPMLIIASLIIPIRISTGTQTSINSAMIVSIGMIGLWIFDMITREKQIRLLPAAVIRPSIAFIVIALIAFLFGQLPWYPGRSASLFSQLGGLSLFILLTLTLMVTIHRLTEIKWLQASVWIFIILGGIYNIAFLIPPFRPYVNRIFQRAVLDSLFWLWLLVLTFGQAFLNHNLSPKLRLLLGLSTVAILYNLFIMKQSWTSGWLPAFVAVFFVVLFTRPKLAFSTMGIAGIVFLISSQFTNELIMGGDNEYSLLTRLEAWKILGEIIKANPLFGLGPSNYYFFTPYYRILGYSVNFNSHNNYIDIVAQIGLLGLFVYFWLIFEIFSSGWRARKLVENKGFTYAYIYSALGGVIGVLAAGMFGDWVIPFVYNVGMEGFRASVLGWVFMGYLVFIELKSRQNNHVV
ncbi:MAG: O-antigen polymerase [Bellilinea sp.]|nr:MAG: O-antigen polymerase [Bellilinea sp.]